MKKTPDQTLTPSNDFGNVKKDLSVVIEEPLETQIRLNDEVIKEANEIL